VHTSMHRAVKGGSDTRQRSVARGADCRCSPSWDQPVFRVMGPGEVRRPWRVACRTEAGPVERPGAAR
jgi:hypothetical protein